MSACNCTGACRKTGSCSGSDTYVTPLERDIFRTSLLVNQTLEDQIEELVESYKVAPAFE